MIHTKTCRNIGRHPLVEGIVELILNVCGLRMVPRHAPSHSHRRLEVIVTPFQTSAQTVVIRQREDALQMGHRPPLVTLQLFIVREIGIIRRELSLRVVAVCQCDGRKIIIVRMTVPVHIERHLVSLIQFP